MFIVSPANAFNLDKSKSLSFGKELINPYSTVHCFAVTDYPFTPYILVLMHQQQRALENIVEKGEIACYEQFLLFPQCFLLNQIIASHFANIFDIISLFTAEMEKPKIGISGKGLNISLSTKHAP